MPKSAIKSIKQRNRIVQNILTAITERDHFLVTGHKNPDEDCISSMIAISILINKFGKAVYLVIPDKINENYQYLLNICRYNAIEIISNTTPPASISTVLIMDTPKPSMREEYPGSQDLFRDNKILKIEIDHHLGADSEYSGDHGYCLVDEASSACELVGLMGFKLSRQQELLDSFAIEELLTRNFILAVLTGIIGDSKMGQYLKTRKERWFYELFSSMFNKLLARKTRKDSTNFSTMDEVFQSLQQLSHEEDNCFREMITHKIEVSDKIGAILIPLASMIKMRKKYDHETIVTVARYTADHLAEKSRYLGLVGYFDDNKDSNLVQFRLRRSHDYSKLDLRNILERLKIENGGGHPGAIGFRLPQDSIPDPAAYISSVIQKLEIYINELENV